MVALAIRRRQSWIWDLSQQREPLQQQVEESEENEQPRMFQEVEHLVVEHLVGEHQAVEHQEVALVAAHY